MALQNQKGVRIWRLAWLEVEGRFASTLLIETSGIIFVFVYCTYIYSLIGVNSHAVNFLHARSHKKQFIIMTYVVVRKASKRKAKMDRNMNASTISPSKPRSERELLQALRSHRQQEQQDVAPPSVQPPASLPSLVRPIVAEPSATTPQQIAMLLAAALQEQNRVTNKNSASSGFGGAVCFSATMSNSCNSGINQLSRSAEEGSQVKNVTNFSLPMKLYAVLSTPKFEHILSWVPHGRAWKIHDLDLFCAEVLPIFMNGSSIRHFHGFVSLLNLWGFRQFTKLGPDTSAFFHRDFLRGSPSLLQTMSAIPQASRVPLHDPSSEPNLYAMPSVGGENKSYSATEQQVNISLLASDLLKRVVESRLPGLQGLRDHHSGLLQRQQQQQQNSLQQQMSAADAYARSNNIFASCVPATLNKDSSSQVDLSSLRTLRAIEGLLVAKQVHDSSLQKANNSNQQLLSGLLQSVADARPALAIAHTPAPGISTGAINSKAKQGGTKPKKPRRKWLPPLGPASPLLKITAKTKQHNADASSIDNHLTTSVSGQNCEWLHTSPEAFAALASPSVNTHIPSFPRFT